MSDNIPPGDAITGSVGDNAHNVALGKAISQSATTVTSSGERSLATGGNVSNNLIVTGDHNQVYLGGGKPGPPLHYPPRADHFVDREEALRQLLADLQPGRVVTLCGPGGIGKTALAAEALARLAADPTQPPALFPDGVFFHSFYNQKEAALALEQIARSFGEEPRPTPTLAAQRALAGKRALLLLDGAEDADNLPAVLGVRGQCGVLVTSRKHSDAPDQWQDVKPLPEAEAVALLHQLAGPYANGMQADAARAICTLVGDLPLAVRLVGRYLAETALLASEYFAWLQATPLQALNQGERRDQSVNVLLERSVQRLSPASQRALSVVGVLALAPFPAEWVALALDQTAGPAVGRLVGELVNYGLFLRQEDGLYTVSHALIHTYAAQQIPPPAESLERLAAHFRQFAEQQSQLGPPGFAALDAVLPHLLRVLETCVQHSLWSPANQLVWALDDYLDVHGRWSERILIAQVGLRTAHVLHVRYDEGAHLSHLGLTYSDLGRLDKAIDYYQQAIIIYREIGDRRGENADLGNLGLAYNDLGQAEQAIGYYQQALAISQEIGDRRDAANHLGNLGLAYANLGQLEQAIEYYKQALTISREIGDRRSEGNHLGNLGNPYRNLGQVAQAIEYYEQALTISRQIGDRRGEGNHLGNLGLANSDLGQVTQAIEYYEQALAISRQIGDRRGEGIDIGNLGNAYYDLGQVAQAIEYYQQALVISRQISDRRGEGVWLGNLAGAYRELGQLDAALACAEQGLQIARETHDPLSEAYRLWELGRIYRLQGKNAEARSQLQQALALFEQVKSPQAAKVRNQLAEWEKQE